MPPDAGGDPGDAPGDRERLAAIRSAESLSDLVGVMDAGSEHEAYFAAKREWYDLRKRALSRSASDDDDGLPGDRVEIEGQAFHVHGITHADTRQERAFLREHVDRLLEAGAAVYCEQGIRPMYFSDVTAVFGMDDYVWARGRCEELGAGARVAGDARPAFDGIGEDLDALAARFREAAFSLVHSNGDRYGDGFARALGDVASAFLTSHEDAATGGDFESFRKTRLAARNPRRLVELQNYYEKAFLPQPLEREWLRRHDRELEVFTHARNERMADYLVYHAGDAEAIHAIVGAAHQPGVIYYLEAHRDGRRRLDGFEPVG